MGLGFVVNIDHAGLFWGEFQSRLLQVLLLLRERELVVITTKRPYPDIAVQFMYMEAYSRGYQKQRNPLSEPSCQQL